MNTKRKLFTFHGGLHIPDHKAISVSGKIRQAALPSVLILPLRQHIGKAAKPIVKVGDKVLKGEMLASASARVSAPVHAPTSGTITDIRKLPVPHASGMKETCLVLESDGKDEWCELPPPLNDYHSIDKEVLIQRVHDSGIVGLGGATFPSAVKLKPKDERKVDTLIINGAECEPYITCDDMLMREDAKRIVEGILIVKHVIGAAQCLIGIEDNKPEAISAITTAVNDCDDGSIEVVSIPTIYPSGGERQLIRILTGKEVPSQGIPADIGIVCHNVATAHAIADAVVDGRPLISRVITVTGSGVAEPQNFHALIGVQTSELIAQAGGYSDKSHQLICGGPMMGFSLHTDSVPVTKGMNCLLAASLEESPDPEPERSCIRCGKCAEVCPANLLPQQLFWYSRAKDFDKAQDYHLFDCIECGCCTHVCPSHIQLVHYYRFAKTEIWNKEQEKRQADHARQRHEARLARLERLKKERESRLRKKREDLTKKPSGKSQADPKKAAIEAAMKRVAEKKAAVNQVTGPDEKAQEEASE